MNVSLARRDLPVASFLAGREGDERSVYPWGGMRALGTWWRVAGIIASDPESDAGLLVTVGELGVGGCDLGESIVFRDAFPASGGAGLDLPGAGSDDEVGDEGVCRFS